MADWTWVESPGTALEEEPRVSVVSFGDGYEQRAADGLSYLPQRWSGVFNDVDDAIALEMIAFLRTNAVSGFNYVPKWSTTAIKVVAESWRRTLGTQLATSTITVQFRQVFEP